jgi:hypothetical protein
MDLYIQARCGIFNASLDKYWSGQYVHFPQFMEARSNKVYITVLLISYPSKWRYMRRLHKTRAKDMIRIPWSKR